MKRRLVASVVLCLVLCGFSWGQGRLWKALGNIASAVGGATMDRYLQQSGYSANESREIISNVSSAFGMNSTKVQQGIDFMDSDKSGRINMAVDVALETTGDLTERQDITSQIQKGVDAGFSVSNADNKYEKANIIAGTALEAVGNLTGAQAVTNKISAYVDANMTYLSDVSKAETVADLQQAADKKNQAYTDLIVDVGMELYDRKVAKEDAERQERIKRQKQEREMKGERGVSRGAEMTANLTDKREGNNNQRSDNLIKIDNEIDVSRNTNATERISFFEEQHIRGSENLFPDPVVIEEQIVVDDVQVSENKEENLRESQKALQHAMINDVYDRFPEEEKAAAIQLQHIVLDDYAVNEVVLSSEKCERLAEIAELLKRNPEFRINLVVYTSSEEKSKTIGYERAREAREYLLMRMGIGSERVFIKEYNKLQIPMGKIDVQKRCITITVFRRGESGKVIGEL